jgi:hypothetical protein
MTVVSGISSSEITSPESIAAEIVEKLRAFDSLSAGSIRKRRRITPHHSHSLKAIEK